MTRLSTALTSYYSVMLSDRQLVLSSNVNGHLPRPKRVSSRFAQSRSQAAVGWNDLLARGLSLVPAQLSLLTRL